jgi:KUP system potassium uptake protein
VFTIVWALLIAVSLKYVLLVMRADNRGEGATMALTGPKGCAKGGRSRASSAGVGRGTR